MIPIRYNVRSLIVRKQNTFAAAFGLALVVWLFASARMLARGLEKTFGSSSSEDVAVVLRKGSSNELQSSMTAQQAKQAITKAEQLGASKKPAGVAEAYVVIIVANAGGDGVANVPVRGVTPDSLKFRPTAKIIEGVAPKPGSDEVLVGKAIRGRFRGLELGQSFDLKKNRPAKVVGILSDGGSQYESEIWADLNTVQQSFGREGLTNSVRVRLDKPETILTLRGDIEGDKQLGLTVMTEREFFAKESRSTVRLIGFIGNMVAFFFSIAAMIGATITMNAQVAGRTREIGTLRALGFSRSAILFSFLFESLVLALGGGAVGAIASFAMVAIKVTFNNFGTWSVVVFGFEPTPGVVISSLVVAALMGLVGGFLPAVRAARISPLQAMRE